MKIPLDILQAKKALPTVSSLSEADSQALTSLAALPLTQFCQALPACSVNLKQVIPSPLLFDLYNKMDEALEQLLEVKSVLQSITNLMAMKANRSMFRSLDRLLKVIKSSEDQTLIQSAMNVIFLFFKNRDIL